MWTRKAGIRAELLRHGIPFVSSKVRLSSVGTSIHQHVFRDLSGITMINCIGLTMNELLKKVNRVLQGFQTAGTQKKQLPDFVLV